MKIKKFREDAITPTKAHKSDAAYDLYACNSAAVFANDSEVFDIGIGFQIPDGYAGFIFPRSSMNVVKGANCTGVVDSGYTGSIKVKIYNHSYDRLFINKGDRIAQIAFLPVLDAELEEVIEFEDTERGNGGFGSTGR